jgi:hypothetical protein
MNLVPLVLALATATSGTAASMRWNDLFETTSGRVALSARLRSLEGKSVRIIGYMAQLEDAPRGAFYLASRPVSGDESGGGTADLPPDAIRVTVRSMAGSEVGHVAGPIEVTGVLHLGAEVDEDGRVSRIRIVLAGPTRARP